MTDIGPLPDPDASREEWIAYHRAMMKFPLNALSAPELRAGARAALIAMGEDPDAKPEVSWRRPPRRSGRGRG
jgi:hypothetical protein